MTVQQFSFAFHPLFGPALRVFGVHPGRAWVRVDGERLRVRYGFFYVETPLSNISDAKVTGPYSTLKALGPRGSIVDGGATYGTTGKRGVCIRFHEPVKALKPKANPALTVTVTDPEGLAEVLRRHIAGPAAEPPDTAPA